MPRFILLLVAVLYLATPRALLAAPPDPDTRILPQITAALERYKTESERLDAERQTRLRETERAYYLKLNRLKMDPPNPPSPKGMFETTEEYQARMARHQQTLAQARERNHDALTDMERKGGLRILVAEIEVKWLEAQLQRLAPLADTIARLQNQGCRLANDSATITVQRPDADAFHFPVTLNHKGTLYRNIWPYTDRNRAETIWRLRHELKATPHYTPEPTADGGIRLTLTAFVISGPDGRPLTRFTVGTPAPFDAVTRLARIRSDELPAARILLALSNAMEGPLPGMRFVFISPRPFDMGSHPGTPGRLPDETLHRVVLKRPFYMQTTEVTQAQWEAVMGSNPSAFPNCGGDCPVDNVYWQDAVRFITKLNAQYKGKGRFRLPTEAEWEYTARTGTVDPWVQSGNDASVYAWYRTNAGKAPHPVAKRRANMWNIYDMNGNVSEWCSDWYGPYPTTALTVTPKGPLNGKFRVSRGGSWFHGIDGIRGAHRNSDNAGDKSDYIGFRLVLDLPEAALPGVKK